MNMQDTERIRTWKVQTTSDGIVLWINGKPYKTHCGEAIAFDIDRCAQGFNPPAVETSAQADARPFGPGTLDVLLAAETADPGAVCDAIEAIAGEEHGRAGAMLGRGFVLPAPLLAALVRALRGGSHGA